MLCRRHHRAVHEDGYQVDRQPDGALRFRCPNGRVLPEVPPPPEVPGDPVHMLRTRNEAEGLHLHPRTAMPSWLGEPLNVGYAIDVLHPVALGERTRSGTESPDDQAGAGEEEHSADDTSQGGRRRAHVRAIADPHTQPGHRER